MILNNNNNNNINKKYMQNHKAAVAKKNRNKKRKTKIHDTQKEAKKLNRKSGKAFLLLLRHPQYRVMVVEVNIL
jgi:hypothetical protein